jgi:hypothetical protein
MHIHRKKINLYMAKRPYDTIAFNLIFCVIFMSAGLGAIGQEKNQSLLFQEKIEWDQSAQYPSLPFEGAGYFEEASGLPVFLTSIPLPKDFNKNNFDILISPLTWDSFSGSYMVDIKPKDLPAKPKYRIVYQQKAAFLEIEMAPFRLNEDANSKWEKLQAFSVNISYSANLQQENLKSASLKYATSSHLSNGQWVKIGTAERGIHKISYSQLQEWGFSSPSKVCIYGNGGTQVPLANNKDRPDDLPKVGCLHTGNALYFYSPATWRWFWDEASNMFRHQKHQYSQMAFFFLTQEDGTVPAPPDSEEIEAPATHTTSTYDFLYFHEQELENVLKSGNQWFGEKFNATLTLEKSFKIKIPNILTGNEALFFTQVFARSNSAQNFGIDINNSANLTIPVNTITMNDNLGYYGRLATAKTLFNPINSDLNITYRYNSKGTSSIGWLDYFIITARAKLTINNGPIIFRDQTSIGSGNITTFQIEGAGAGTVIWDVTNPQYPLNISTTISGNKLIFKDRTHTLKEYVAFNPSGTFPQPKLIGEIPNQNLHATQPTEMVIVAPKEFLSEANRLATLHTQHSNLNVTVAERDQIYNEFSWGHPDPGAIRSFVKMLYDRAGDNTDETPKLLLLFGDGTYDNRHIDNTPAAPLPTYQSDNSIYQTSSFVTDDFFGFLDDDEGAELQNDRLDIGIGRYPVNSREEAINAVNKSENYLTAQESGKWKTKLTFTGDDGDFNIHMRDADKLAQKISANHPQFILKKIYFDAYEVASGAVGKEFPGAKADLQKAISEGTLIFNYTGHGSEENLAHEKIVTRTDILNWKNKSKLPLFVTATCEFSRFDNHHHTSSGEEVFLNPNGGGIALLSTTRIVYSSLNFTLNNAFYNHAFEADENGLPLRLGEMMRRTKLESGSNTNKLNFTLLGDPALRLNYPPNDVSTLALNGHPLSNNTDTIKALSKNIITAAITDPKGKFLTDFNGTAFISVFDKAVNVTTLGNGNSTPFEYKEYSNILFKGRASVTNGEFSVEFVIPRDIRYNFDKGRINYYALSDDNREAAGAFSDLVVGGRSDIISSDESGPVIDFYLNHAGFKSGQTTGPNPMLYADIFDASGINTSGIGIGHNITLVIDGNANNPLILNNAFTANIDDYQKGTLAYQLPILEEGNHEITLKVWDNNNNSSIASLNFRVSENHGLKIREFSAYPNPVKADEDVYITLQTDSPNSLIDATIRFINASGAITGEVNEEFISSGNFIGPYRLPLEKSGWKHSGICFVQIIFETQNGQTTSVAAKLLPTP